MALNYNNQILIKAVFVIFSLEPLFLYYFDVLSASQNFATLQIVQVPKTQLWKRLKLANIVISMHIKKI